MPCSVHAYSCLTREGIKPVCIVKLNLTMYVAFRRSSKINIAMSKNGDFVAFGVLFVHLYYPNAT